MKFENDKIKCPNCGSWALPTRFAFRGYYVRGWECSKCKERIINPEDGGRMLAINKLAKEKNLIAKIAKVGNSFVFRVPKEIVTALGLREKEILKIRISNPKLLTFAIP